MFKIKFDDRQARQLALQVSMAAKALKPAMDAQAPVLGQVAEAIIMESIAAIPHIGEFLAVRTKIDTVYGPGIITLSISGMTEEEAGFPPTSGGAAKGNMNLWNWHEFGPSGDAGAMTSWLKDAGGVRASRKTKAAGTGSKYKGAVKDTIGSLTVQLNTALQAVWGAAGQITAASVYSKATGGKVKIPRKAQAVMRAAGVEGGALAAIGVSKITVSVGGQIKARGASGKFVPMKSTGIPTTIRTK